MKSSFRSKMKRKRRNDPCSTASTSIDFIRLAYSLPHQSSFGNSRTDEFPSGLQMPFSYLNAGYPDVYFRQTEKTKKKKEKRDHSLRLQFELMYFGRDDFSPPLNVRADIMKLVNSVLCSSYSPLPPAHI